MRNHLTADEAGRVRYCSECEFYHLFPVPDEDEVRARYFDDEPYDPEWILKEVDEYAVHSWFTEEFDHSIKLLTDHIDLATLTDPVRVLDVGCGCGWFVNYVNSVYKKDVVCWGLEPSDLARTVALHLRSPNTGATFGETFVKDWDELVTAAYLPFDAVRYSLVFEHLADPDSELKRVRQYLRMGGAIQIKVPSEFNPLQKRVGGDWWINDDHVNYFTADSLRALLERNGYVITDISATFPTELWILLGLDHRTNAKIGRFTHRLRLRLERLVPSIWRLYRWLYKRYGIGREIIVTGVRVA